MADACADENARCRTCLQLLRDGARRERMGLAAQHVFDSERGAVHRVMQLIDTLLQE